MALWNRPAGGVTQPEAQAAASAAIAAADLPDAADMQASCGEALAAAVTDLTIPGANTPYLAALAAIDERLPAVIGLSDADVTLVDEATATAVAGVGGQSIRVHAVHLASENGSPTVRLLDSDDNELRVGLLGSAGIGSPVHVAYCPSPWVTLPVGKGLKVQQTNMASTVRVLVKYRQF